MVDSGAFDADDGKEALNYKTSYVEYILLMSAPGIGTSPSNYLKNKQRRQSFDSKVNIMNSNKSSTPTHRRRGSYGSSSTSNVFHANSRNINNNNATHSNSNSLSSLRVDLGQERNIPLKQNWTRSRSGGSTGMFVCVCVLYLLLLCVFFFLFFYFCVFVIGLDVSMYILVE